jgi:hypothetical protein
MYQPGIPTGTVDLSVDYQNLQDNFTQINTTYGIDHVPLTDGTSDNGYHKAVHLVQQVAPAAVAGVGSLYSTTFNDKVNTDQTLYYKTGANRTIQMTMNFVPVLSDNGYTFFPGGLIFQWGKISPIDPSRTTPVLFATSNINFPTKCFGVTLTLSSANASQNAILQSGSLNQFGFTVFSTTSIGTIYWTAIGN